MEAHGFNTETLKTVSPLRMLSMVVRQIYGLHNPFACGECEDSSPSSSIPHLFCRRAALNG